MEFNDAANSQRSGLSGDSLHKYVSKESEHFSAQKDREVEKNISIKVHEILEVEDSQRQIQK